MNKLIVGASAALAVMTLSDAAFARNDRAVFPMAGVLNQGSPAIDRQVPVHFGAAGGQAISPIKVSVKIAAGAQPRDACNQAFKQAVIQLQDRAKALGGNSVANIASIHGRTQMTGSSEFLCGIGNVQTNVVLQGTAMRGR
jgi:uncharacterized protein YbjQ (UPF0145 family)